MHPWLLGLKSGHVGFGSSGQRGKGWPLVCHGEGDDEDVRDESTLQRAANLVIYMCMYNV